MSRSYRKPYATEGYGSKTRKITKRKANRAVRRSKNIKDGMSYKKEYNSWDIVDYKFYIPNDRKFRNK